MIQKDEAIRKYPVVCMPFQKARPESEESIGETWLGIWKPHLCLDGWKKSTKSPRVCSQGGDR